MSSARAMHSAITDPLEIDRDLTRLSERICSAEEPILELDYLINKALGLPQTCSPVTSLDDSLRALRAHFPAPEWRYGFQDAGYKGWTGPVAWLNNGRCQRTGFDNHYDLDYRYFERTARTIEAAFAALVVHALAHRGRGAEPVFG